MAINLTTAICQHLCRKWSIALNCRTRSSSGWRSVHSKGALGLEKIWLSVFSCSHWAHSGNAVSSWWALSIFYMYSSLLSFSSILLSFEILYIGISLKDTVQCCKYNYGNKHTLLMPRVLWMGINHKMSRVAFLKVSLKFEVCEKTA